jgi:hypothetical protein
MKTSKAKAALKTLIKRHIPFPPASGMSTDNLYAYLDALRAKKEVSGPVVEIGVANGGTTAFACRFLERIGSRKQYYCIDTYQGFVASQLDTDHRLGLSESHDDQFSRNSVETVKNNLASWGVRNNIHFVRGDICAIEDSSIPDGISVCLLDVDLRDPIYCALKRLESKMAPDGIILVDDCKEGTSWVGANEGYADYVKEKGIEPKFYMGFAVVEHGANESLSVDWQFSAKPNEVPSTFYG